MSVLGLDIGSKSAKAVELEKRGKDYKLLAAGIANLPVSLESDSEQDMILIAEAITKLLSDAKIASRVVNLSLPENKVFTRFIKLPYLSDTEVESAISWQAEPYIPIPVDEASIDYQIIRRIEPQGGKPGAVEVLLIAAPRALVRKYTKVTELAGLSIGQVETEMLALVRSIAPVAGTAVIADFGASSTSLGVVRDGQLVLSHSIATGGDVLTRAVASALGLNLAQAEEYKKAYGMDAKQVEGKVAGALAPVFRLLVDEVKKAMQYYKTEVGMVDQVSALVLSGGTAGCSEIVPFLAQALSLEVLVGDPFAKVLKDQTTAKAFVAYGPLYGVAVGLAME